MHFVLLYLWQIIYLEGNNVSLEVDYKADENTELNIIRKLIQLKEYQTFEN